MFKKLKEWFWQLKYRSEENIYILWPDDEVEYEKYDKYKFYHHPGAISNWLRENAETRIMTRHQAEEMGAKPCDYCFDGPVLPEKADSQVWEPKLMEAKE